MDEPVHPVRVWCVHDDARAELTAVQDGADGISVVTVPYADASVL